MTQKALQSGEPGLPWDQSEGVGGAKQMCSWGRTGVTQRLGVVRILGHKDW